MEQGRITDEFRAPRRPGGAPLVRGRRSRAVRRVAMRAASRWREGLSTLAMAGVVAVLCVTAWQVRRGWDQRRAAARSALAATVAEAARRLEGFLVSQHYMQDPLVVAPVIAARSLTDAPVPLATVAEWVDALPVPTGEQRDSLRGVFRIDLRGAWPTPATLEATGVVRDTLVARALLEDLERRRAAFQRPRGRGMPFGFIEFAGRGAALHVVLARQFGRDDAPRMVFGVVSSRDGFYRELIDEVRASMPLLPARFEGVDLATGLRAAPARAGDAAASSRARRMSDPPPPIIDSAEARRNGILAVRMFDLTGRLVYTSPGAPPDAWTSPYQATVVSKYAPFRLEVAIPSYHGDRVVAAAVPVQEERRLLLGLLGAGLLLVAATGLELRRVGQLARARRDFVSAVSHELRTPLTQIAVLSETMLLGGATSAEQQRRWLGSIHREAVRLGELLGNVLLFSRGERRALRLERRRTDVAAIVRESATLAQALAAGRLVRVRTEAPESLDAVVDGGAVRQVVLNLLDNAVKYGPDGQTVALTLRAVPDAPALGPAFEIVVDDEGPGVAPAERRRIWSTFERVGDRGGATGGSGLGLSVVRELVHRHGGTVAVGDAPGGGARFTVVVPVAPVAPGRRSVSRAG